MNASIDTLRQRLHQLKTLHDEGTLSAEAYAEARTPLERQLLDHVMVAGPAPERPSRRLVGGSAAAVLALAVAGYAVFGSPGLPSAGAPGSASPAAAAAPQLTEEEFIAQVEKLAARMKEEPGNAEGWGLLARSYARLGRHAEAVPAFAKAVAIVGDDPSLLVDWADALAMSNGRVLEGEPIALVERALKSDPDNGKGLALSGTAAFNRKDYKLAVQRWERLASVSPPDSGFLPQLQNSIDEARSLAGMPPGPRFAAAASPAPGTAPAAAGSASAAATGALLTGTVKLAPALAAQARPEDVVFVFARPAEGARMPLAILRYQVKDLPVSFRLDDSLAMSPAMKLSAFPQVVVTARVSKSGQAAPAPGDLSGQSAAVANQTQGLVVEINEVVKP